MPTDLPLTVAAYVFLVVLVTCRAGATYGLGRLARRGSDSTRAARLMQRPLFRRSERVVNRFGAPAVSVSFLTVGVQSAVNLAAGFLRMPLRHYAPALVVGALIWAGMYLSVGLAVLRAWQSSGNAAAVGAAVLLIAFVAGLTVVVRRRWSSVPAAE